MKHIEIVTHAYSSNEVPIYHKLFQLQIENLLSYRKDPDFKITYTVFYTMDDHRTTEVIHKFKKHCDSVQLLYPDILYRNFFFHPVPLFKDHLFRRAIGRNLAAKNTHADVVWFTDVDYLFFEKSLQVAHEKCLKSDLNMIFPREVNIHAKHGFGDSLIRSVEKKVNCNCVHTTDLNLFVSRRERRAIGGIQIVKGDWCRKYGYLNGTKWVESVSTEKGFLSCKCDVPFRKSTGGAEKVTIPGVYRIRHSRCGRDQGDVDHGKKTK